MRIHNKLMERLAAATPKTSVLCWLFITAIYSFAIVVNDHFDLITAIGLPEQATAIIRLLGVQLYIFLTAYSFHKTNTKNDETNTDHNQVAADLAHPDEPDHIPATSGAEGIAQGHRQDEPQPEPFTPGAKAGNAVQRQDSLPNGGNGTAPEGA